MSSCDVLKYLHHFAGSEEFVRLTPDETTHVSTIQWFSRLSGGILGHGTVSHGEPTACGPSSTPRCAVPLTTS
jgi:hypothetical protein